jgi:hypothetical protein
VHGYEATVLPEVCKAILDARKVLTPQQQHLTRQAEILLSGLANVGIIELVDEVTGYQDFRSRDALAEILEAFVAKEIRRWVRTFPPEFYSEMLRLRGMTYQGAMSGKRPRYFGILTNNLVYDRLAPGVRKELQAKNPAVDGRRKHKHFQWLTTDVGHPKLQQHLISVVSFMRASKAWTEFRELLDRALPKYADLPLFPDEPEDNAIE